MLRFCGETIKTGNFRWHWNFSGSVDIPKVNVFRAARLREPYSWGICVCVYIYVHYIYVLTTSAGKGDGDSHLWGSWEEQAGPGPGSLWACRRIRSLCWVKMRLSCWSVCRSCLFQPDPALVRLIDSPRRRERGSRGRLREMEVNGKRGSVSVCGELFSEVTDRRGCSSDPSPSRECVFVCVSTSNCRAGNSAAEPCSSTSGHRRQPAQWPFKGELLYILAEASLVQLWAAKTSQNTFFWGEEITSGWIYVTMTD